VALRPRLSPGVPLSRDGKQELGVGTGDVNKASSVKGTVCATVLAADQLERIASGLRTVWSRVVANSLPGPPHWRRVATQSSRVPIHCQRRESMAVAWRLIGDGQAALLGAAPK
jgi:hypothetical protein